MRKSCLTLLLAVLMCMGLATTASAGGYGIDNYADLVAALAAKEASGSSGTIYVAPSADFGWPEVGTLTVPANVSISASDPWEIPAGITVNFATNSKGISSSALTINGTMHTAYSSQDSLFNGCQKVIIGPTGTFTCADDEEGSSTRAGQYIGTGKTWEVLEGGNLNAKMRVDGTLTGAGTVSGTVNVRGGFVGKASNATLSGDLTLCYLDVGNSRNAQYADTLSIPAGSCITLKDGSRMNIGNATVTLGGTLELTGVGQYGNGSSLNFKAGGKMIMEEGSKLLVEYPGRVNQDAISIWDSTLTEETRNQVPRLIEGTGTIRLVADEDVGASLDFLGEFANTVATNALTPEKLTFVNCFVDFTNITLERSWACEHVYDNDQDPDCNLCGTVRDLGPDTTVSGTVTGGEGTSITINGESVEVNEDGTFELPAEGEFDVVITKPGCLTYTVKGVTTVNGNVELPEIELVAGDVNGDDKINISDMGAFRQEFGKTGENISNVLTDVNNDGKVNIADMGIFRQNFGKTAEKDCTIQF